MRRTFLRLGLALAVGGATIAGGLGTSSAQSAPPPAAPAAAPAADLAAAAADQAAASGLDALAKGPNETFVRRSAVAGSGGLTYFAYERTYRGLPVVGGDAVVVADQAGHIRGTTAARSGPLSLPSITYKVRPGRAEAIARAQLTYATDVSDARLVVLATGTPRLAWEVLATGTRNGLPSNLHVYVDARTGKIATQWDDVHTEAARGFYNGNIDIDTSGGLLRDPFRPGLSCANINTRQVYRNGGTGTGRDLQTACVDAYYAVEQEYDMLGAWLDRSGINGNGGAFPLFVGLNDVNAFWNGSSGSFGHSADNQRQATSLDVVAHEMGHAIFQTTPGGSGGGNETGGINESTGDIFGALTEHFANNPSDDPDYLVGEEVNLTGNGPIRVMYNPQLRGHPNCWSPAIPGTEVHAAAGPNNHWFYLTAIGSSGGGGNPSSPTCNGSSVTGIGLQKAGQIYMGALNMKTSFWRYANVRTATLRAAVNLFGAASQECRTVKAAWDAVDVPAQPGEAQCQSGPSNDFSIRVSPTSGSVAQGSSVSTSVITQTTQGGAQQVSLSASGLPAGVSADFSPGTVTSGGSSTLTLTASAGATTGTRQVTVTGDGSSGTHTTTYTLTVTGGNPGGDDFSLSLSPSSATVQAGDSTQATVSTATTSGSPQTVNLTVSGAPTGVTATVSPASVTSGGSATLSISTASTTAAGTYELTVTGAGESATHAATFSLEVQGGGPGGCGGVPAWGATTSYEPGDQVSHNGHLWNSTWWSTGAVPGDPTSWAVWSDAGPC